MLDIPTTYNPMAWQSIENWTTCAYCDASFETEDHVPPQCLFDDQPKSLISVPACEVHNNGRRKVDEAFRDLVAYHTGRTPETCHIWDNARRAREGKPMPDLERLRVLAKGRILDKMGDRMVRGLHWYEYGRKLPTDSRTQASLVEPDDNWRASVRMMNTAIVAEGQFMYAYRCDPRDRTSSVWFFVFQRRLAMMALTRRLIPERSGASDGA
jgi:hypothetical protein